MRTALAAVGLAALALLPPPSTAAVIVTTLATPLTTDPNPSGGYADGTGVWFNPLSGYAESRGYLFPSPLYQDGQFFLLLDASYTTPEAMIYTQGYFARGNSVIYDAGNLNAAWFGAGVSIGPGTGYQDPGYGYPDIGPTYGNAPPGGGRGFLGLTIRDASGASSSDVFYGFADVTVNPDYSLTLNAFAYENVRGAAITTFTSAVPEAGTGWAFGLGLAGIAALGRRSRRATPGSR
jgi:hypothetical protein